uniref:Uncharacterized protein n=1 Tax=Rhizophora mucronata TaxID=61149 RepID=A0A2P2NE71_RHIMU
MFWLTFLIFFLASHWSTSLSLMLLLTFLIFFTQ